MYRLPVAVAATLACLWLLVPGTARADVGGSVPGPGLCEYPGVGMSFQIMNGYGYYCDFPTEINGAHWHCEWGGGVITANGSVGVNIMMFSASLGLQGYVGGVVGTCTWRCPDLTMAEQPNPPGGWQNHINPTKCKTVGVKPPVPWQDAPPPPELPFAPPPPANPPNLDSQGITPAVTNPIQGNPDATENPPRR